MYVVFVEQRQTRMARPAKNTFILGLILLLLTDI